MAEYIEREAAERILASVGAPAYAIHALALVKTADVVPVVHGRWGELDYDLKSYCPNCGAHMKDGE